jgi:chaperonin GroES
MTKKLVPLQDNVIVKPLEEEHTTKSGILIPDTANKEKPVRGKVLAVGPGKMDDKGKHVAVGVKEGDIVIFTKYAPTEIKIDGEELYILGADSLLAIEK